MSGTALWLRWSWRDLRARWVQVAVIALIIALGTGSYAGMSSVMAWRTLSNEASYGHTNMYDLRVHLSAGSFLPAGTLTTAVLEADGAGWVKAAEERLIFPTQVDASTDAGTVLVPGRVVGMDLSDGGPHVTTPHVAAGRSLGAADAGAPIALLESHFADHYGLPAEGEVRLAGDRPMRYVGHALAPEYFMVVTPEGGVFAHPSFAVVFTSLETAQALTGVPGMVNDLVLTLAEGADRGAIAAELERTLGDVGAAVTTVEDDPSYGTMTRDVEGDQQFYNVFAVAIFAGAALAAFNLTTRMVEAQRREIGIGMALGLGAWKLALRPLLVGAQIALLGVAFGVGVGVLLGEAVRTVLSDFFPLPVWETPFQPGVFAGVAALGFAVPFLATALPVWRATRVAPVDAVRTGHLASRGGGLAPLLRRLPLPGDTLGEMPFRNLLRAPRRALLTLLGIAAIITVLIGFAGVIDSFLETIDRGDREMLGESPDRLAVYLDTLYPIAGPQVDEVTAASTLSIAEPALRVGGGLRNGTEEFDVLLHLVDFESALWRPTAVRGALDPTTPGVIIAEKAAKDLGVGPGDRVTLRHPQRRGALSFAFVETELPVLGVHPHPFRSNVYMDLRHAELMGLQGAANLVYALPSAVADAEAVNRELFGLAGVASVERVAASTEVMRDLIEPFLGILRTVEFAVLGLAVLIAFNTASINADERAREHATMFAFGVPLRTVLRVAVVESLTLGVLATALGLVGGYLMVAWMAQVVAANTMPDLGMVTVITPSTIALMMGLGVLAVAAAPLLTIRRLRRMDIPSALRVME